ncbi:MAG: biopolymer transporter ExbD [Hyphomicrobiales bacterium]
MRINHQDPAPREANLVPLINVVFLMLVFFLIAGSLRPFMARDIDPPRTAAADPGARPRGPLAIAADGQMFLAGEPLAAADLPAYLAAHAAHSEPQPLFVVADRALPAAALLDLVEAAKAAGIAQTRLVTRRRTE